MVKPATTQKSSSLNKNTRRSTVTKNQKPAANVDATTGNSATTRKKNSLDRVKELGLKSVKIDLDEKAYAKIKSIYEAVGFKLINRKDASQLKGEDVSSLLSCIIRKLNTDRYDKDYGVFIFLMKIKRIIKFRMNKHGESAMQIAKFLNKKKIGRPMYLKLPKCDGQNGGKWIEQNVLLLDQSKNLKEVRSKFPKFTY